MRSSTLRASASLVLFLAAGGFAHADGPAAVPAAPDTKPSETKPSETKPSETKPAQPAEAAKPAPPEAKPAAAAVQQAKPPGTAATVVNMKTIEGAMGKAVRSRTGNEDMGHIVDILVDANGDTRAAVIDFGGFLGVGSRKVAVGWKTLDFADSIQSGSVKLNLTRDQVRQAPEFKADEPIVILEGAGAVPKDVVSPKDSVSPKDPVSPKESAPAKPAAPSAPPASPAGHNQDSPAR